MKALVLKEYKRFAYEDMPAPQVGPEEVLVAVKACGICGSDVHGMDGSTGRRRPPIIMGHEAAGLIAVDVARDRLALAEKVGATDIINSAEENAQETILRSTQGRGADLSFEAVGITPTVELALRCLRKGGAATLVGNVAPKIEFPLQIAVTRELTIYGSCASRGEYPACLEMLSRGELQAAPLISATAPLADGPAWFDRLYRK